MTPSMLLAINLTQPNYELTDVGLVALLTVLAWIAIAAVALTREK